jgi:Secretion system C-terminal sorting domain
MEKINQLKNLLFAGLIGLTAPTVLAQNMVPNPSFETHSGCPTSPGNFSIVGNWFLPPSHGGSPDYHHVCGNSTFGVPVNIFGSQLARTGQGYIGFVTNGLSTGFREYLEVQLTAPLTTGLSYTATAYLSLSDGSGMATDGFGFLFSTGIVGGSGSTAPLPFTPQVSNPSGNFMNSWTGWLPVTGNFVATPGLQYMTIGNFKSDAATGVLAMPSGWNWNYTYADDFSVTPTVVLSADMTPLEGHVEANVGRLSWQTLAERGTKYFEVERSIGDYTHFEKIGTLQAHGEPDLATDYAFDDPGFQAAKLNYYRVKEVDQNGEGGYTETIALQTEALLNEVSIIAYPSPLQIGDALNLQIQSTKAQTLLIDLVDLQGRAVLQSKAIVEQGTNTLTLPSQALASGWYVVRATGSGLQAKQKIMVLTAQD